MRSYFNIPTYYCRLGCSIPNEPLGDHYVTLTERTVMAAELQHSTDCSTSGTTIDGGQPIDRGPLLWLGTVDWVFPECKSSKAYLEKAAVRSRPDYERTMLLVADVITNKGDRLGGRRMRSITPRAAEKIYDRTIQGKNGLILRQGEKAIALCAMAWDVVRRQYPDEFDRKVPNPWDGVTIKTQTKKKEKEEGRRHARASLSVRVMLH